MPKDTIHVPETQDYDLLLRKLQYERELDEREAKDAQKASALAARLQGRDSILKQRATQLANQAGCPHMKPLNGGSAIAGQKDHRQVYHWICQYCQKEWEGAELPAHLRIDLALVGGPSY